MSPPEKPRCEPEIIPPGQADKRETTSTSHERMFVDERGAQRIYVARVGPFGIILLALLITLVAAVLFVVVVGAFLLWIPLVFLLVAAAIFSERLRNYFRRVR